MRHAIGLLAATLAVAPSVVVFAHPPAPQPRDQQQAGQPPAPQAAQPAAGGTGSAGKDALWDRATMLAPIQVQSLTLTPIIATADDKTGDDDLLVLDEAMAAKQVKIQEIADGSVNELTFVNRADHPVFIMAGEVILGGKQDRIIGRNTVIPAKTTQAVPVFCVEHGRWDGTTKEFTTAKALAHGRLRGKASYAAQQDVWNEVAAKNKLRKTETSSGTYRRVAQQQSDGTDGTLATMQRDVDTALAKLPTADRTRMIGYAVALNGSVATVDVFSSPRLFHKLETKLLHSYLTESIDVTADKTAKPPTQVEVRSFMADADKAAEQKSYDTDAADTVINSGERTFKAKVAYKRKSPSTPAANAATAPAAAAPPAPAVYENYQAR